MNFIDKTKYLRCSVGVRIVYLYSHLVTVRMQAAVTITSGDKYESVTRN